MNRTQSDHDARLDSRWASVPTWLLSLAAHLLLAILGSLLVRGNSSFRENTAAERPVEIVLAKRSENRAQYFNDEVSERHEVLRPAIDSPRASGPAGTGPVGPVSGQEQPPLLANIELPAALPLSPTAENILVSPHLGPAPGKPRITGNLDEAAVLAEDALIPRPKQPTGPTAQLSLFGAPPAEGRSFVFVIDRSASMGRGGLGAHQAAAKELARRIDQLTDEHTFQVVAYNQSVVYLTDRELITASAENKRRLVRFIADLPAYGQTEHGRGLLAALRLKPEVIFLLTDGGDPAPDAGQLRLIREAAASNRTSIHCLHFGRGAPSDLGAFLPRLAAENRGSYAYIDMNAR